jgi:mono/diheme cytochrome c family protein
MRSAIISILVFVLVVIAAGLIYMYSGAYNVSATARESPFVSWLLGTARDRSIETHAANITIPTDLASTQLIQAGAGRYHDDCEICHGSPGAYPGTIGKGLNPEPPKLWANDPDAPSPAEVYWVIMHGIKMTGMPSWEHEYKGDDAWSVVAFVRELPRLTPQQYQQMVAAAPKEEEHH